jgi:predicted SnoaL-like aldol condensation-catalyzing enzyme
MSQTKEERNNARVLEAFETLFKKRDYVAAERFWSPNYIQHSAHIAPGRAGRLQSGQDLAALVEVRARRDRR